MDQRAPKTTWPVQEAKNQFSRMLEACSTGPQTITRHGREAAFLLSAEEYHRMKDIVESKKPSFIDLLLAIPKAPPDEDPNEEIFPRMEIKMRDVDF